MIFKDVSVEPNVRCSLVSRPCVDKRDRMKMRHVVVVLVAALSTSCEDRPPTTEPVRPRATEIPTRTAEVALGGMIISTACASDGRTAAVIRSLDNSVELVDPLTGRTHGNLLGDLTVPFEAAFAPNCDRLVVGYGDGIGIWDLESKSIEQIIRDHASSPSAIVFSPECDAVYFATKLNDDAEVRRIDLSTWNTTVIFSQLTDTALPKTYRLGIDALAITPNGSRLAVAMPDGTAIVDLRTGEIAHAFPNVEGGGSKIAFSPDGQLLGIGRIGLELWDVASGQKRGMFGTGVVTSFAFFPSRQLIISIGEGRIGQPSVAHVWRISDGTRVGEFSCHNDVVLTTTFVPQAEKLITGCIDGTYTVWDLSSFLGETASWPAEL